MKRVGLFLSSAGIAALLHGCVETSPCAPVSRAQSAQFLTPSPSAPYVGDSDPYEAGKLAVRTIDLKACENDAPTALRIHAPEVSGTYAVVLFQHGFMSRNSAYDEILTHLSSHGFVVVAPQMYEPSLGPLLGNPTAAQEAELAAQIVAWLPGGLRVVLGSSAETNLLGIAGHSRGGKVAWLMASADPGRILAIAGIDPVDGTGGPFGNQPRVVNGPFALSIPALVLGTELGGSCAPAGDNHEQFFEASTSPAWHVIALSQGHGDMLDESEAEAASTFCSSGPNRGGMRRFTAGLLVALFRTALQGDDSALTVLEGNTPSPIAATFESK